MFAVIFAVFSAMLVRVSAFSPAASVPTAFVARSTGATTTIVVPTNLYSSVPETEDEEGLDLNLEEMFDM
jgi:hypothetical protein